MMYTQADLTKWTPANVINWLTKLRDDSSWINADYIREFNITGKDLSMMTAHDLVNLGATKVDIQEHILDEVEKLKTESVTKKNLQMALLRLSCLSRSLQKQLVADREAKLKRAPAPSSKVITLSRDFSDHQPIERQRVSLYTLALVSSIAKSVSYISDGLKQMHSTKQNEFRSIKSLLLALSIELTSTAQRDQFVERPNDIIEKSSKAMADYCDRIVQCDDLYLT